MADFLTILRRMLDRVSPRRDKREGSIIRDALAPMAMELAQADITREVFSEQTYLLTAVGENLDRRVSDFGMVRRPATPAIRIAETRDTAGNPMDVPAGARFATPNIDGGLNFTVTGAYAPGQCLLTCDAPGTAGNAYLGAILPLETVNLLGSAEITGTFTPGENTESDDALRARAVARLSQKAYGGNVADYKRFTTEIDGVGAAKVFPVWDGGGTVKLSIVDGEFLPVDAPFVDEVQTKIDPIPNSGDGLGLAPIGHRVTVVTPGAVAVNVTATVTLEPPYIIQQVQADVERAVRDYIFEVRGNWAELDTVYVFLARVTAAIVGVEGIANVTGTAINGAAADLELLQTAAAQAVPVFGSVVLSGA